jgi:exodeoxyribonuclease III
MMEITTMQIATWNINGIRARLEVVKHWLELNKPDLICVQEIKTVGEKFPAAEFEALGYNVAVHGQKSFNGVAILSRHRLEEVNIGLDGDPGDTQARFMEVVVSVGTGVVRIAGIYLPNGNPVPADFQDEWPRLTGSKTHQDETASPGSGSVTATGAPVEKFGYKLGFMDRLITWTQKRLELEEPLVLMGDFNIIPADIDTHNPAAWRGDALYRPESLNRYRALLALGLTDGVRAVSGEPNYTFWDFQAGAWRKNNGIRIDHFLLSPQAADRLQGVEVHRDVRGWDKPSDHVPVVATFGF